MTILKDCQKETGTHCTYWRSVPPRKEICYRCIYAVSMHVNCPGISRCVGVWLTLIQDVASCNSTDRFFKWNEQADLT